VGELTTVRRAFHTLKGSSRMVGLREYGEAAWACEQLYNARLAQSPRMDPTWTAFTRDALDHLSNWTDAIADGRAGAHHSAPIVAAADSLRLQGRRVPIGAPAGVDGHEVTLALPALAEPDVVPVREPVAEQPLPAAVDEHLPAAEPLLELPLLEAIELPELDLSTALTDRVPDLPLAADLDLSPPAAVAVPAPEAPAFELDLADEPEIDIQGLQPETAPSPAPAAETSSIALPDLAEVVEVDFGEFDLRRRLR
jgi:chemosensory pili system protein ChpA (sensor histidine kinase/response regulator)